jgi:hypothetical protein
MSAPVLCVVANMRDHCKYFREGAKLYVLNSWHWPSVEVLGQSKGGRWIDITVQAKRLTNWRIKDVYDPKFLNHPKASRCAWLDRAHAQGFLDKTVMVND